MYENIYKKKNWSSLHYKKYGCALKACHFILRSINAKMSSKVDSVFRTRSLGTAASGKRAFTYFHIFISNSCFYIGLADQYADGKAAKVWKLYIGEQDRTLNYKKFLVDLLRSYKCQQVLDAACGTG